MPRWLAVGSISLVWFGCIAAAQSHASAVQAQGHPSPAARAVSAPSPESDACTEAVARADALLAEAKTARDARDAAGARERIAAASNVLLGVPAAELSSACVDRLCVVGQEAYRAGDLRSARACWEAVVSAYEKTLPDDHPELQKARGNLAVAIKNLGDLRTARALEEKVLEVRERSLPDDHAELQDARLRLGATIRAQGDLRGACVLFEKVLAVYEKTLPDEHPDLQRARLELGAAVSRLGDLQRARALQERVLEIRERTLPDDDPLLQRARHVLALTLRTMGDLQRARALEEKVIAVGEKTLPEEHPDLQSARQNLGATLYALGDIAAARAIFERIVAIQEKVLPDDHPDLQSARQGLAAVRYSSGDLPAARVLFEKVLVRSEKTLPDDHPDLQWARNNLATTILALGDLQAARVLFERVLASRQRTLPDEHPDLQSARGNLAAAIHLLGDLEGARALGEKVLAAREKTLPDDHPDLQTARGNLAMVIGALGDLAGARALEEKVVEMRERALPRDHPDLQAARLNLALTIGSQGDLAGARALEEEALTACEETLPDNHPRLQGVRAVLAEVIQALGDLEGARTLEEKVLAARVKALPADHPALASAQRNLIRTLACLRERDRLAQIAAELALTLDASIQRSRDLSTHERETRWRLAAADVSMLLSIADQVPARAELELGILGSIETMRASKCVGSLAHAAEDDSRLQRSREARKKLADAIASEGDEKHARPSAAEISELVRARDVAEREVIALLAARGKLAPRIDASALARALPADARAIGLRRYTRTELVQDAPCGSRVVESLVAFVLAPDGSMSRVELGPIERIAAAVGRWRAAIGKPLERGVPLARSESGEREAGVELRRLVLDPLLSAIGEATTIHFCLDDALHLVPLDALPLSEPGSDAKDGTRATPEKPAKEALVGERWSIRIEPSFARFVAPPAAPSGAGRKGAWTMLAVGGVAFNAELEASADGASLAIAPPVVWGEAPVPIADRAGRADRAERGGPQGTNWDLLPQTRAEAEGIGALFEETFDKPAVVLTGTRASKQALIDAAQGARFFHVATHGYFAPDSVRSLADPLGAAQPLTAAAQSNPAQRGLWSPMGAREAVTGMAPMALCGLALAGANRGMDSRGHVPGILTAEELAGLDLASCELAVLSACETNVGITRAGQGIRSLQAALHAAGARTAVASLWKVDDEKTRELFADFYTRIWVKREPKARALWNSKMALRRQGCPTRDWAGWTLTGDPD